MGRPFCLFVSSLIKISSFQGRERDSVINTMTPPIRVLVALEQLFLRDAVIRLAEDEPGIEIVGDAANCNIALQVAIELAPDVALVGANSCMTPECSILQQFQEQSPQTKVVILSGSNERERIMHPIRQGAAGYMVTDVTVASVFDAIRDAASGGRPLSPSVIPHLMDELQHGRRVDIADVAPAPLSESKARIASLSLREREVMRLVCRGKSNREIARMLSITEGTVKNHVHGSLAKLEQPSRLAAASFIASEGGI